MKEPPLVLNMDDITVKRGLMQHVGSLRGLYEVTLKPRKQTRSLQANSFYWIAVVTPFMHWLRETQGDPSIDKDQAHEMLKTAVLGTKTVALPDGCFAELAPRTRGMKTDEFAAYVEAAAKWLGEFCNIAVLPSEMFYERPEPVKAERAVSR